MICEVKQTDKEEVTLMGSSQHRKQSSPYDYIFFPSANIYQQQNSAHSLHVPEDLSLSARSLSHTLYVNIYSRKLAELIYILQASFCFSRCHVFDMLLSSPVAKLLSRVRQDFYSQVELHLHL